MSGSNVVPWPMPSSFPPGCCPPGGDMNALLQCYCDIQAATAFISKVVTDLAANDPAFQKALVDGIAASGSNLPLIGVTNGVAAQPGQVGEVVSFVVGGAYPTGAQTIPVTMGVLPPGDWDVWATCTVTTAVADLQFILNPLPAGFDNAMQAITAPLSQPLEVTQIWGGPVHALISVPTLVVLSHTTNNTAAGPSAGNFLTTLWARRSR